MTRVILILALFPLLILTTNDRADTPLVLNVWPGKTPMDSGIGQYGPIGPEHVRDPNNSPTKTATWITAVTVPTITVYRPPKNKDTGTAFIICPGGGYWNLAWDLEGTEVAEWFRDHGITGIVLKYRCPRRQNEPERLPAPGPVVDAQRAISLVRSKAKEWGIDPNRIGIGGFSAGAHLALMTGMHFDQRSYEPMDDIDKESCRPNFIVSCYTGYLVDMKTWELKPEIRLPAGMPPVMLVHANDDTEPGASSAHSAMMYLALKKAGVPAELHIYSVGEHGFGIRKTDKPVSKWGNRCVDWLRYHGLLKPEKTS